VEAPEWWVIPLGTESYQPWTDPHLSGHWVVAANMDTLPVELIEDILQHIRPNFTPPSLAGDAVWGEMNRIPNWWSRQRQRHHRKSSIESENDKEAPSSADGDPTIHYRELLPLRL
jgi:hypothetical protein